MEQVKLDIPRVLIFTKVSSTRLNNTLHAQYHRKQYDLVMAVDKTKLKLPLGLPEAWNKGIDYETMIDQEAAISSETAKLKAKDEERDKQLTNIFGIIRAQRHSHKPNISEAAIRLSDTLSPYEGARSLQFEMESGRIEGMKKDLTKRTAEVATLGLNDEFDNLFKLNEEFEKLHVGRRVEKTNEKLPQASVIRPQTDAALEVVCQYIQSAYNSATSADDKALLERLVDHMNATSDDFKKIQRNLIVHRPKDENKKPKTPKEPKPKKPGKDDGKPDIKLPEEEPKKPDPKQPDPKKPDPKKPGEGGGTGGTGGSGGGPEIHLPEE